MKITDHELRFLSALNVARTRNRWDEAHGGHQPLTLLRDRLIEPGSSVQGLHQTAASLVRKGLVKRSKWGSRGYVSYTITLTGLDELKRVGGDTECHSR